MNRAQTARPDLSADAGVALVTVLAMLAVLALLAVAVTDSTRMAARRTINQSDLAQARWYLLGAEAFAVGRIGDFSARSVDGVLDARLWSNRTETFPLDEGLMTVTLKDGNNCFNINGLVAAEDGGGLSLNPAEQSRFALLLDMLNVRTSSGASLTTPLIDWLDADTIPGPGGAEDDAYGGAEAQVRPPNWLIADKSELAAVAGFSPEILAKLSRFVCVRPTAVPNRYNPNTLSPTDAPLLAAVIGAGLTVSQAEGLLRNRPAGGWTSTDAFLAEPALAGLGLSDQTKAQFDLTPLYFVLAINVQYRDQVETSAVLIRAGGQPRVLRRVFGANGVEQLL